MKSFQDIFRRIDPSLSFFHDARPADFPSQRFFFFPSMESEQMISFNGEDKELLSYILRRTFGLEKNCESFVTIRFVELNCRNNSC